MSVIANTVPKGKLPPVPRAVLRQAEVRRQFREGAGVYELAVKWGTRIPIIESILRGYRVSKRPRPLEGE